ncbi:MAG: transposase [Pseudomonadota bacterium]
MTTPRSMLVDSERPLCYHLVSRCVRRAFLCGTHQGQSYEHRKDWIEQRILSLGKAFAVDVLAYAVMSNHFHIVIYFDPGASQRWSDEEVARRWSEAFSSVDANLEQATSDLLSDSARLERYRARLGSLSAFMQHLKQPIAVMVNREERVKGHLFEQRFYSAALLDESAVLAAMRYVDLNPVRARIASTLEDSRHTSIQHRLRSLSKGVNRLEANLQPVVGGVRRRADKTACDSNHPALNNLKLGDYLRVLRETETQTVDPSISTAVPSRVRDWQLWAGLLRRQQRAYGKRASLDRWLEVRGFRRLEAPFSDYQMARA